MLGSTMVLLARCGVPQVDSDELNAAHEAVEKGRTEIKEVYPTDDFSLFNEPND